MPARPAKTAFSLIQHVMKRMISCCEKTDKRVIEFQDFVSFIKSVVKLARVANDRLLRLSVKLAESLFSLVLFDPLAFVFHYKFLFGYSEELNEISTAGESFRNTFRRKLLASAQALIFKSFQLINSVMSTRVLNCVPLWHLSRLVVRVCRRKALIACTNKHSNNI